MTRSVVRRGNPCLLMGALLLMIAVLFALPAKAQQIHPNRASMITAENADTVMLMAYRRIPQATEVYWSPGNQRVAVVAGASVRIYETIDLSVEPLIITHDDLINDVAWNPDGRILAVASRDAILRLWSVPGGLIQQEADLNVRDMDYSADGSVIAFMEFDDSSLNLYNVLRDTVVPLQIPEGLGIPATGLAFNRTGNLLVVGSPFGGATVWDVRAGEATNTYDMDGQPITERRGGGTVIYPNDASDFARNDAYIAAADTSGARNVNLWNANTTELLWRYSEGASADQKRTFVNLRFSRNSDVLAAAGGYYEAGNERTPDGVLLFRSEDGIILNELRHLNVTSVTFSNDGRQIATAGGGMLQLWRLEEDLFTPEELRGFVDEVVDAFCAPGTTQPTVGREESVAIGWSWYAIERDQLQDHIDNAVYTITLDNAPIIGWTFISQPRREPQNFDDFTSYWYLIVDNLLPGERIVRYQVTWRNPVRDGYDVYGPGTGRPSDQGQCLFQVSAG